MAGTVEAQTAEEAKSLSKTESCDRKPVIICRCQPTNRNLAVNKNINQIERLMRDHGAAKMRLALHSHVYLRRVCYARLLTSTIFIRVQFINAVQGTGTSRSGPGLNVCWLIKDRLRRGYKAQLPPCTSD